MKVGVLRELFRPFAFGILGVSCPICASWWAKLFLFHVLSDVDIETFHHMVHGEKKTPHSSSMSFNKDLRLSENVCIFFRD